MGSSEELHGSSAAKRSPGRQRGVPRERLTPPAIISRSAAWRGFPRPAGAPERQPRELPGGKTRSRLRRLSAVRGGGTGGLTGRGRRRRRAPGGRCAAGSGRRPRRARSGSRCSGSRGRRAPGTAARSAPPAHSHRSAPPAPPPVFAAPPPSAGPLTLAAAAPPPSLARYCARENSSSSSARARSPEPAGGQPRAAAIPAPLTTTPVAGP